ADDDPVEAGRVDLQPQPPVPAADLAADLRPGGPTLQHVAQQGDEALGLGLVARAVRAGEDGGQRRCARLGRPDAVEDEAPVVAGHQAGAAGSRVDRSLPTQGSVTPRSSAAASTTSE